MTDPHGSSAAKAGSFFLVSFGTSGTPALADRAPAPGVDCGVRIALWKFRWGIAVALALAEVWPSRA